MAEPGAPLPPGETGEGSRPATVEDVHGLRRWIWVAGIWAAAASVIALLALFAGDDDGSRGDRRDSARLEALQDRVDDLERETSAPQTDNDVDDLRSRVEEVEGDVSDVQGRVDDAGDAGRQVSELEGRVDELDARLDKLESESNSGN